ncbi:ribonuclease HI [Blattabacterium cuenoti]|uniref:ribonuclease HI n=1 Tax=Blattabacterium cuenoti TaxID=1653831 RepID=UPI00293BF15D|nr:RNase H family protein [Blattabacterium cuenoti]
MNNNRKIHIYTDGSSRGNPGVGGYGIFIEIFSNNSHFYKTTILNEGYRYTTNNRMELLAIIIGLEKIKKKNILYQYLLIQNMLLMQ